MTGPLRVIAFIAALLVYAGFSAPTPDHIGPAELIVLAGLLAAMGAAGIMQALHLRLSSSAATGVMPFWVMPARILLLYGLSVPLITGLAQGHPLSLILRDMVPFLFLLLPLFIPASFIDRPLIARALPWVLCLMGVIFCARVMAIFLLPEGGTMPLGYVPDPDNLVNAPTVLFAALFLTGMGGWLLAGGALRSVLVACLCFAAALFLLASMAAIGQRAHIGAWVLVVVCWLALLLVYRPRIFIVAALLAGGLLLMLWPVAQDILQGLMQKHTAVGL
ncbi:MAG TPA: hypothetical protein VGD95_08600, partial [Micavibrio sp.]